VWSNQLLQKRSWIEEPLPKKTFWIRPWLWQIRESGDLFFDRRYLWSIPLLLELLAFWMIQIAPDKILFKIPRYFIWNKMNVVYWISLIGEDLNCINLYFRSEIILYLFSNTCWLLKIVLVKSYNPIWNLNNI